MMEAVWMRLRAELRARWRSWMALGIAIGIASGVSIAAASGAVRAETAYPRYVHAQRAAHVTLGGIGTDDPAVIEKTRQQIASFPEVVAWDIGRFVTDSAVLRRTQQIAAFPNILVLGPTGLRHGIEFDKPKLLEGRLYDPSLPDEGIIDWIAADKLDVRLGDVFDVRFYGTQGMRPDERLARPVLAPVRVVGIVVFPGAVPAVGQVALSGLAVTPAFMRSHERFLAPGNDAPSVLLRSENDIPSFLERLRALPVEVDVVSIRPEHVAGVKRTLRFEVLALWALCALVGMATVAVFGQGLARMTMVESADFSSLAALGMSRSSLTRVGIGRATAIGLVAAIVAAGVGVMASVFTPIGISRVVEPDPGVMVNAGVLTIGLALTLIAVPALALWPSFRVAKAGQPTVPRRPSSVAVTVSRWAPVAVGTGVQMALDPGRGRRAVPLRSAVLGSLIGIGAVAGSLVFASGLAHLIRSPDLYGFNWSLIVSSEAGPAELENALTNDPDVEALSRGGGVNMLIGKKRVIPFVFERGAIGPTILSGRAPATGEEVVLGPTLMRDLGLRIGDSVVVEMPRQAETGAGLMPNIGRLRVVGTTVVPAILFQQVQPGEGAALTVDAIRRIAPDSIRADEQLPWIVRYRPGVDVDEKHGELFDRIPFLFTIQLRQPGGDLISLIRVEKVPVALAGILALMAAATLMHALLSSIRHRRHDVAVLKTLGFHTHQVRRAIGSQAATLTAIALAIGMPAGIAAGRWAWSAFAANLSVLEVPRVPALATSLLAPATLVLAVIIAALPGRSAARTRPALVLRTE